jgi:NAD(P)H-dependent FMN reductase
MLKLHVITVSTRPTRIGPKISKWFHDFVCEEYADSFDTELVDLADFGLPVFNEPKHPRLGEYEHEHTKAWSRSVDAADAFAFVSPEYNYGPPPSFVNAVTYLSNEWQYKPAAFVSYGGVAAGLRGAQMEKLLLTTLKVVPLQESVPIPMVAQHFEDDEFVAKDIHHQSVRLLMPELLKWATALKTMRDEG